MMHSICLRISDDTGDNMKNKSKIIILDPEAKNKSSKEKPESLRENLRHVIDLSIFCLCALIIGIVTGAIDAGFGIILLKITEIREAYPFYFIPFLPVAGLIIFFMYDRFGKETREGMNLVFKRAQNDKTEIKLRLIPFVTLSTWMTHLFGGSAGREGVAVQIGGTLGNFVAKHIRIKNPDSVKILTVTGMAAGFAGLFRTPMAAVFFATEVICAGRLEVNALLPGLIAAFAASITSGFLGLEQFRFNIPGDISPDLSLIVVLCISGILFGFIGGGFAFTLKKTKKLLSEYIKNPYIKIAAGGAVVSIVSLLMFSGRYSGLGTNLIADSLNGDVYAWDFIMKFLLTVITVSAGFQGGEVTPLFAIGATLGALIGIVFNLPVVLLAALGYAAVFGAATNTLIAPMFIGIEVFGYNYMPYFFAVCALAYIFNGNNSIYTLQKKVRIRKA